MLRPVSRWLALVLVVVACQHEAGADGIPVPNGDFALPKKVKHGGLLEPEGFRLVEGNRVTRFQSVAPHEHALALGRKAAIEVDVVVPKIAHPKKLAQDGWYGVGSVDVLGLKAAGHATLTMTARVKGKRAKLASASVTVKQTASKQGKTVETATAPRLWLKIPSKKFAPLAGKTLTLTLAATGTGRVVIDDWRFDRFHDAPARVQVGKPNGKNGPDLLASGALGFTALSEHERTAFSLLLVRDKGPADKAGLKHSDLVVAIDGVPLPAGSLAAGTDWFERGHEAVLGRAIERALSWSEPRVQLTVLRDKGPKVLTLKLPHGGGFGEDFPFDTRTEKLRADVLDWITKHQKDNGSWPGNNIVNSSLAGLALLGTRDKRHRGALRKLFEFLMQTNPTARETKGFSFWPIAFQGMFLCEYHMATGNARALAWIRDAIEWLPSTTHKCKWGMQAFGHSPKGLPYDNKALMAPCAHLLVFDALAIQCGVESKVWEHIRPYVLHSWSDPKEKKGHGGMGYNGSYKDKAEFWSRSGLTALALHLRKDERVMRKALADFMLARHAWMLNSHAYGEPGAALGLVALAALDPKGFADVCRQWRWRFLNAWEPGLGLRYSSPHMGSPYMGEEEIVNPAYGLLLAVRNKGLVLTGGKPERWLARRGR